MSDACDDNQSDSSSSSTCPVRQSCASPLTPKQAVILYRKLLTDGDINEINKYDEVFYLGKSVHKFDTNMNFSCKNGLQISINDHLVFRYQVKSLVNDGNFSTVVQLFDHKTAKWSVCKITPLLMRNHEYVRNEITILELLKQNDPFNVFNCIQLYSHFPIPNCYCLNYPMMGKSLYDIMKSRNFSGFKPDFVKMYATELLHALVYLRQNDIIHCDIKPSNILVDIDDLSNIKISDFDCSRFDKQSGSLPLKSINYRSPEIILRLPITSAIDMWSFGCTLYELAVGTPLFKSENEFDQLSAIMEVNGIPPLSMASMSPVRDKYFCRNAFPLYYLSVVTSMDDSYFSPQLSQNSHSRTFPGARLIDNTLEQHGFNYMFANLIRGCLNYVSTQRSSPIEALFSPWLDYDLDASPVCCYILQHHGDRLQKYDPNEEKPQKRFDPFEQLISASMLLSNKFAQLQNIYRRYGNHAANWNNVLLNKINQNNSTLPPKVRYKYTRPLTN